MNHRHINTTDWTLAAIDSALDRGDLDDWRDLFAAAQERAEIAERLRRVISARKSDRSTALARALIARLRPDQADP